jgi:hypothetical protein
VVALASRPIVFLSGAVTAVLTKSFWSWHFGESILENEGTITWPLAGYIATPSLLGWVIAAIALITLVVGVSRRDVSWILSGLLVMCFGPIVVDTPTNALRAAGFLPVLWAFGPGFEPVTPLRRLFRAGGSPAVTSPNLLLP